jgi:hypothetical protein
MPPIHLLSTGARDLPGFALIFLFFVKMILHFGNVKTVDNSLWLGFAVPFFRAWRGAWAQADARRSSRLRRGIRKPSGMDPGFSAVRIRFGYAVVK